MIRGLRIGAASAGAAVALWIVAIAASWMSKCPPTKGNLGGSMPTGLDKAPTVWPPGTECYQDTYQAMPWASAAIAVLLLLGLGAVVLGVISEVARLRGTDAKPGTGA